jgi:multidrug resistance efflux pump
LIEGLESKPDSGDSLSTNQSLNSLRIQALREELELTTEGLDLEIKKNKDKLYSQYNPLDIQIRKLQKDLEYYEANAVQIPVLAPADGLIGNIHCMESENISDFRSLISFYEKNPTQVKGYVHESMILEVNVGDTLRVTSSLHPENSCLGVVTGLGTRIVEIHERLRKMPQIKNYGREVLIKIPAENNFLQKEKVMLNPIEPGNDL